uniref:Ammonium transporter n=1 Tax=Globodera rostochiensis TaxID=31243 RepID=A0A914HMX2_GLORO
MDPSYANPPGVNIPYTEETNTWFQDDGIWLISCSFSIWTMVSGFGLLESGRVSSKDEVNIMVKNIVDVVFGGLCYWMFGFGFTFGTMYRNPVIGIGHFFYDPDREGQPSDQAWHYSRFFFQMSFATTTSTIVSAAMAERIRLKPYIVITFLMTIVHSISAHWVWSEDGFLKKLGCVDAAGCSVVHLVGGVAGLAATLYLRPRQKRFGERGNAHMSNPTNALLGTFMLWWGWLAFNTGTTMGVARGRWRLAARSSMVTLLSSLGGGCTSIIISLIFTRKCQIDLLIDGLLASLVATTAACHSIRPLDSIAVGSIGSALALSIYPLIERLEIDDPVGVIPVHVVGATWGMLSVGIFSQEDPFMASLNMPALCVVCIFVFSLVVTFVSLATMNQFPWGLRMTKYEEQLGADLIEHGLAGHNIAKYSIEKKLNVSVVKFVAKWKRKTRLSRERRLAEEAAARGENASMAPDGQRPNMPPPSSTDGQQQQHRLESLRLGPVKLDVFRRGSIQQPSASGGTLTARPRSGRRHQIEREKNSLPPTIHSSYRVHPMHTIQHQQQHNNSDTSLNIEGGIQNGVLGNGSVPFGKPITVIRPPTASTMADIMAWHTQQQPPAKEAELEQFSSASVHAQQPPNSSRDARGGGLLSRMRRNTRVQPHQQQPVDEVQLHEQRHSPPLSARSFAQTTTTQRHAIDGFDEMSQRMRRPESAGDSDSSGRSRQRRHRHNIRVNDSIV